MNCKQVQRQLVSYINGELEEKEEEEFVKHIRHCGIRQLDGAEEEIDDRTLVEDYLETSEEDAKDEHFLSTYVFLLRIVVTVLLFYMIVRCFLG